jgi:hypothetical protein
MKITSRYGIKVKNQLIPYGTNDIKKAKAQAKTWNGKVIDFSAVGRRLEKSGSKVEYTYRKK